MAGGVKNFKRGTSEKASMAFDIDLFGWLPMRVN
jgi:hypothetical protein